MLAPMDGIKLAMDKVFTLSHLDFEDSELQTRCLETMHISFGSNKFPEMSILKSLEGRDSQS